MQHELCASVASIVAVRDHGLECRRAVRVLYEALDIDTRAENASLGQRVVAAPHGDRDHAAPVLVGRDLLKILPERRHEQFFDLWLVVVGTLPAKDGLERLSRDMHPKFVMGEPRNVGAKSPRDRDAGVDVQLAPHVGLAHALHHVRGVLVFGECGEIIAQLCQPF